MTIGASGQGVREGSVGLGRREQPALPFPFFDIPDWFFSPAKPLRRRSWTARRLLALAGYIAGSRRADLRADWLAALAELPPYDAIRTAAGMVVAALRLRASDVAQACWWPADRVLESRALSNIVVVGPTAAVMWAFFRHYGVVEALSNSEAIAVIGAAIRGLVMLGRRWRDVTPAERTRQNRRS